MNDQAHKLRELVQEKKADNEKKTAVYKKTIEKIPKSIAITSGKGGVGKSNIALFLAALFSETKKKVLLLDADIGLANTHILLGIAPTHTVAHYLDGRCSLDEVITETSGGFDIIPGASGMEKMAQLESAPLMKLKKAFFQLEAEYDILVVDTGAGIGPTVTQFASSADTTLIIMTPEPTSLADAYTMVKILHEWNAPNIGVIVNMTSSEREGVETFDRLNTLVVKFLKRRLVHYGSLPLFEAVSRQVKQQNSLLLCKSSSVFSRRMYDIARRLYSVDHPGKRGFFDRVLSRNGCCR